MILARLKEYDLFEELPAAAGGSVVVDLAAGNRFSVQAVYDVQAPAAGSFTDTDVDVAESTITIAANGFSLGLKVRLTTDGTLPDPLATATDYFVIPVDANTFQLASSLANALAGTFIVLEDEGTEGAENTVTPVALAGASVLFQKSNDGVNWIDIQTATSITVDGQVMIENTSVAYRWLKVTKAITAGVVDLNAYFLLLGETT